jgi:inner membrane protein
MVPLAMGFAAGTSGAPLRLVAAGVAVAVLPDADVVAWQAGIPYGSAFAHRGFSHSLAFAALVAVAGALAHARLQVDAMRAWGFLFVACASHGALDAFTNGGSGIAFLWPFTDARYFAPVTPIEVSPIGVRRFLTARGLTVLWSEVLWVWLPCLALACAAFGVRRARRA